MMLTGVGCAVAGCTAERAAPPALVEAQAVSAPAPTPTGARTLEGGLVLIDVAPGEGPACPMNAVVELDFVGRVAGGEVFDSTALRGRPLSLALEHPDLIEGLRRGVVGMRAGGVRRLLVPSALAYGPGGREPIPPNADLEFELTMRSFRETAPGEAPWRRPARRSR